MRRIIFHNSVSEQPVYKFVLQQKIAEVCKAIGFDDSDITWIIFDNRNFNLIKHTANYGWNLGELFTVNHGEDYGYCYPARNEIWISTLDDLLDISHFLIIQGMGGIGKSTFLKYLFLDEVSKKDYIPVFIELKDINQVDGEYEISDFIFQRLYTLGGTLKKECMEYALQSGCFLFLLDGYDEISTDKKDVFFRKLDNFCDRFSENYFVISSRPYSEFVEFQRFSVLSLCNLNKKQALSLVKKIEFDSEIKLRFLKSLDQNLYERHKSFASNPLLLNIMLLTFDNYAEIPEKLHLFYANAFETLYSKHDATKSGFRRELRSELSYDNFKKVFAQFCFITYYQAKIELTYDDIVTVLNKIKGSNGITIFRPEDYLYDLVNSICVLYREGVTYKFTHRSFQEYFSAIFLKELSDQNMEKMGISLVKKDYFRASHDSVFFMLRDMAEQRFEQNILLPFVVEFETTCSDTDKYDFYFEELSPEIFFDEVDFDGEIHLVICADFNVEAVGFIYAMARHYRDTTSSHVKQLKDAEDELRNFLISERDYKIEEKVDLTEYRDDSKLYSLLKATWIGDYLTVMANLREMLEHRRRKEEQDLFELLDE